MQHKNEGLGAFFVVIRLLTIWSKMEFEVSLSVKVDTTRVTRMASRRSSNATDDVLESIRERVLDGIERNKTKKTSGTQQKRNTAWRRAIFGEEAIKHFLSDEARALALAAPRKRCSATRHDGQPCNGTAIFGTDLCWYHTRPNVRRRLQDIHWKTPEPEIRRRATINACQKGEVPFHPDDWRNPVVQSFNEMVGIFPRQHYDFDTIPAMVQAQLKFRQTAVRNALIDQYGDEGKKIFRHRKAWLNSHVEEMVRCWFAMRNGDVSAWLIFLAKVDEFGYDEPVLPVNWGFQGVL